MPYTKRKQKCTNASGEAGTYVSTNKATGESRCWKSKKAFDSSQKAQRAKGVKQEMKITDVRLREIILEELVMMEQIIKRPENETSPIDDEVLRAILSVQMSENLAENLLSEDIKDRIKAAVEKLGGSTEAIARVARSLALPIALVASIAAGAGAGTYFANNSNASSDDIALSAQDDASSGISQLAGTAYGEEHHGMSRQEKIDAAWEQFDLNNVESAPVSSEVPGFSYAIVSYEQVDNNTILPLLGATAQDYYDYLKQRVDSNPDVELPLLKKMVFGNVGKWLTGEGNQFFKKSGKHNVLPPDWSVAHAVYADAMEEKMTSIVDYTASASPENKQQIYQQLGVDSDEAFDAFVNDTMFKIGRSLH